MPVATIMVLAGNRRNPFSLGVFASTFLASAFGAAFLLAQFGTGHAQLLRGYEPAKGEWPTEHIPTRREAARARFAELLDEVGSNL